jgi:hypothetical protein
VTFNYKKVHYIDLVTDYIIDYMDSGSVSFYSNLICNVFIRLPLKCMPTPSSLLRPRPRLLPKKVLLLRPSPLPRLSLPEPNLQLSRPNLEISKTLLLLLNQYKLKRLVVPHAALFSESYD